MQADDALLGFAITGNEGRGKLFLYELHVASTHKQQGLGRALLDAIDPITPQGRRKHAQITLNVHAINSAARAFYTRVGFDVACDVDGATILEMVRRR